MSRPTLGLGLGLGDVPKPLIEAARLGVFPTTLYSGTTLHYTE